MQTDSPKNLEKSKGGCISMNEWGNLFFLFLLIFGLFSLIYFYFHRLQEKQIPEENFSYMQLCQDVKEMMNAYLGMSIAGMGLSKQAVQNQEEQRRILASSVRSCCVGDAGARETVKEIIRLYLSKERGINARTILYAIPFHRPQEMTEYQLAEIMMYMADKETEQGFSYLYKQYNWGTPKRDIDGMTYFQLTKEDIRKAWEHMQPHLTYSDELNLLTQFIYADTYGLGVIDTLNQQKGLIEEIQIGMTGTASNRYNYKEELLEAQMVSSQKKEVIYSKDSIHIMVYGTTIRLAYLSFGTEDEMQRVLRNLIKDSVAGELTMNHPQTVIEAVDGRRISIARPPMTDSWIGFIRKFDNMKIPTIREWCETMPDGEKVAELIIQIVRCGLHIALTGEMATGKTTVFRACLAETRADLSVRIVESESLELNPRQFLEDRNVLSMRVNDTISEEEVLAFARKTTGQVFGVGEVNSLTMANLTMNLTKIAQQVLFSAHYVTTEEMIADFTNAKLCVGHYTNVTLAEMDAVRTLVFDIHIRKVQGKRYIQYIHEIIPEFDLEKRYDESEIQDTENYAQMTVQAIQNVRRQLGKSKTYQIRKILEFCEETQQYIFYAPPSKRCFEKAQWYMTKEQYNNFVQFFNCIPFQTYNS